MSFKEHKPEEIIGQLDEAAHLGDHPGRSSA